MADFGDIQRQKKTVRINGEGHCPFCSELNKKRTEYRTKQTKYLPLKSISAFTNVHGTVDI